MGISSFNVRYGYFPEETHSILSLLLDRFYYETSNIGALRHVTLDSAHCNSHFKGQLIYGGYLRKQCAWVVFVCSVALSYRPTSFQYPPFSLFILFLQAPAYFIRTLSVSYFGKDKNPCRIPILNKNMQIRAIRLRILWLCCLMRRRRNRLHNCQ
jgi:hypothetical protein